MRNSIKRVTIKITIRKRVTILFLTSFLFFQSSASQILALNITSLLLNFHDLTNFNNLLLLYHVLVQYLSWPELRQITAAGKLIRTLYRTTGRASNNLGDVNNTWGPKNGNVYVLNSLLIPYGYDLMASENRPPSGLNIHSVLSDAKNFNVAASMLTENFEADEGGAGITIF
ncbi:hypothetical protein MKW98_032144, partial [Papaver atlanticum]